MLYLIGGASRSGKSLLAQRFVRERATACLSIDYLTTMFQYGLPSLGIHHDLPVIEKADLLWPLLWPLLDNIVEEEPAYLVEGDGLLPGHLRAFIDEHPQMVRACFLGYPHVDRERKVRETRAHAEAPNNWVRHLTDAELLAKIDETAVFSQYLAEECAEYHLPFFDVSADFLSGTTAAWSYLTGEAP